VKKEVEYFRTYNQNTKISIRLPGWDYTAGDEAVEFYSNEHFINGQDGRERERVTTNPKT